MIKPWFERFKDEAKSMSLQEEAARQELQRRQQADYDNQKAANPVSQKEAQDEALRRAQHTMRPNPIEHEIDILLLIYRQLATLKSEQRARVLAYVCAVFGQEHA